MNPLIMQALAGAGIEGGGAQAIQQIAGQLRGMQGPAEAFNNALATMQIQGSAATTVITSLGNALSHIPVIGPQIQQLTTGFAALESQLKGLNQFVRGFSPFDSKLLDKAFDDLNASFGEQLIPVVRAGTQVVRWFGDTLAGLTPIVRPLIENGIDRLTPLFQSMGDAVRKSIVAMTPLVPLIEQALAQISDPRNAETVALLGELMVELTRTMVDQAIVINELGSVFNNASIAMALFTGHLKILLATLQFYNDPFGTRGEPGGQGIDFANKSRDKSYQQTTTTSPDALLNRMQQAAFAQGSQSLPAKQLDVAQKQLTATMKLDAAITQLGVFIGNLGIKIGVPSAPSLPNIPYLPNTPQTIIPFLARQFQ